MIPLLLGVVLLSYGAQGVPLDGRIVGGTNATRGEFPMMVSVRFKGEHMCGGTILDELHILTAAHCIISGTAYLDQFHIQYGILDLTETQNIVPVAEIISHPGFTNENYGLPNDIAIVKLTAPLQFSALVAPTTLPSEGEVFTSDKAVLSGWGYTYPLSGSSIRLKKTTLDWKPDSYCKKNIYEYNPESNICTALEDSLSLACFRDSGGPVFAEGKQVGIISFTQQPCQATGHPTVSTKISHYLDWIKQNTH